MPVTNLPPGRWFGLGRTGSAWSQEPSEHKTGIFISAHRSFLWVLEENHPIGRKSGNETFKDALGLQEWPQIFAVSSLKRRTLFLHSFSPSDLVTCLSFYAESSTLPLSADVLSTGWGCLSCCFTALLFPEVTTSTYGKLHLHFPYCRMPRMYQCPVPTLLPYPHPLLISGDSIFTST